MNNLKKEKITLGDIVFGILAIIICIVLIPFYSSIFYILMESANLLVGFDTYLAMLIALFCFFGIIQGFAKRSSTLKIISLIVLFITVMTPFWNVYSKKEYFKENIGDYNFEGVRIILPETCEFIDNASQNLNDKLYSHIDSYDVDVEYNSAPTVEYQQANSSDKLKCMPSRTHFAYLLSYKDSMGIKREIIFDSENGMEANLKAQSFNNTYTMLDYFFRDKLIDQPYNFKLYFYNKAKNIVEMTRNSVYVNDIKLPLPHEVTIENFNQDDRIIVKVEMSTTNTKKARRIIEMLDNKTDYPIHVILDSEGGVMSYYYNGEWLMSENDLKATYK